MAKDKSESTETDIGALVRELESNYNSGTTTISKHVQKSMKEDLETIDAYVNSKHTSGETDSLGREKPFFNIVTAARNIWYRATDINRKDFRASAKKMKHTILAFLATVHIQDYMERDFFGKFLNYWGLTLATYGSAVVKFIIKDGHLHADVVPWNRLIVDPISFDNNPVIEILELTEAQLYQTEGYDKDIVEQLCNAQTARTTTEGVQKDNRSHYIKLYEVHGLLPLRYLTGKKKDEYTYVQQMHVISFVAKKDGKGYDDYTLYAGREENPYMITHLIEESGQTLSIGAVQGLFNAQWMINHTMKSIKDQLDLASKLIFQTADPNYVGQNALTAIEQGDILVHAQGMPLTQVANNSHDITALQFQKDSWKVLGMEINGISEAMMGINPKSHTTWRQTQAVLQESYSLFDLMKQNKKLYAEEMLRRFIIPFIKKYKLNDNREIAATLESYDLDKIDSMYILNGATKNTNKKILDTFRDGGVVYDDQQAMMMEEEQMGMKQNLASFGNQRFFKPDEIDWKTEFKDVEWDVRVEIEGENVDTQDALTTLDTTLKTIMAAQGREFTPEERLIINKILAKTGQVSPAELSAAKSAPRPPMPMPEGQQQPMQQSPMQQTRLPQAAG